MAAPLLLAALLAQPFPQPFHRRLTEGAEPPMSGDDVTILQQLLRRPNHGNTTCTLACGCGCSHVFDGPTADALECVTNGRTRALDAAAAAMVLRLFSSDHWTDDGAPAAQSGHLYKILIPVHRNRSVETTATLLDAHNAPLFNFPVRTHGHDVDTHGQRIDGKWPDLSDTGCPFAQTRQGCVGLNSFSADGATPTGLSEIDLNAPEDSAKLYGPYPINRFVRGLAGNAAFLLPSIRNGVLIHTGEWQNYSAWQPGQPMPNSAGCVHAYPDAIRTLWRILVEKLHVQARPNTDGKLPYPFAPQGLAAVYEVGETIR